MKTATITVDNSKATAITVNSVSDNIDLLNYNAETIQVNFSWTAAPLGSNFVAAQFEARLNQTDDAGSGPINVSGTITDAGSEGTVSAMFVADLSALAVGRGYFDVITLTDDSGNTKTWVGNVRTIN